MKTNQQPQKTSSSSVSSTNRSQTSQASSTNYEKYLQILAQNNNQQASMFQGGANAGLVTNQQNTITSSISHHSSVADLNAQLNLHKQNFSLGSNQTLNQSLLNLQPIQVLTQGTSLLNPQQHCLCPQIPQSQPQQFSTFHHLPQLSQSSLNSAIAFSPTPPVDQQQQQAFQNDYCKFLQSQISQMTFKMDKIEQENSMTQERLNSLMKICQLQQKFQENWEDEQEQVKKWVEDRISQAVVGSNGNQDGVTSNKSLKEELSERVSTIDKAEVKRILQPEMNQLNQQLSHLQEQINKLGEEIAFDINDLEKQIKNQSHASAGLYKSNQTLSIQNSFASFQEDAVHLNDSKFLNFLKEQFQKLDDRKCNIEDFKIQDAKFQKLLREFHHFKKSQSKMNEKMKNVEDKISTLESGHKRSRSGSNLRLASRSKSRDSRSPINTDSHKNLQHLVKNQSEKILNLQKFVSDLKNQFTLMQQTMNQTLVENSQNEIQRQVSFSKSKAYRDVSDDDFSDDQTYHQLSQQTKKVKNHYSDQEEQDDCDTFDGTSQFNNHSRGNQNTSFTTNGISQIQVVRNPQKPQSKQNKLSEFRKIRKQQQNIDVVQKRHQTERSPIINRTMKSSSKRVKSQSKSVQREKQITPFKQNLNHSSINQVQPTTSASKKNYLDFSADTSAKKHNQKSPYQNKVLHHSRKRSLSKNQHNQRSRERSNTFDLNAIKHRSRAQLVTVFGSQKDENHQSRKHLMINQSMHSERKQSTNNNHHKVTIQSSKGVLHKISQQSKDKHNNNNNMVFYEKAEQLLKKIR